MCYGAISKINFVIIEFVRKDEKYRNKGIGTVALRKIIDMAKEQNKDMSLEVIGENIARDLYERLGFVLNGETEFHYQMMKPKQPILKK